ncbi:hypothetical protein MMC13_004713 [Lambiella insularis]|nr:hypothetical protein [Lambiella insularis]
MPPWLLPPPSSRGIGFHLTRHLLRSTSLPIVATARSSLPATKAALLSGLDVDPSRLDVLELDVTDERTIASTAAHCLARFPPSTHHLHLALCTPGVLHPEKSPAQIDAAAALLTFTTNTLGPLLLFKHFSPFLPKRSTSLALDAADSAVLPAAAVFAAMSARVGSIADNRAGGWYSYRASKAGVNQLVRSADVWLESRAGEKAMAVGLHPGTVRTGLSREFWGSTPRERLFEPEWVAGRLLEVVRGVGVRGRGRCWDWKGEEIPP